MIEHTKHGWILTLNTKIQTFNTGSGDVLGQETSRASFPPFSAFT